MAPARPMLLWLFLVALPALGQPQPDFARTRDSLLTQLRSSPDDTGKVYQYLAAGLHYEASQLDSAGYYYRLAGTLSERLRYPKGLVRYANYYTYVLNQKGKLLDGLALNQRAVAIARQLGDEVLYAKCLGNLGASYQYLEQYETALRCDLQALPILESHQLDQAVSVGYANLAAIYDQLKQYRKAQAYGNKAVALARRMKAPLSLIPALINLSVALQHQQRYTEATTVLADGLRLSQQLRHGLMEANIHQNLSNIAQLQGQYERAQHEARQALTLARALDLPANVADAILSLGIVQLYQRQYDQAADLARQGEALIRQRDLKAHLADFLLLRSDAELGLGHIAQFDHYRQRYDSLQEQRIGQKVVLNTQRLEAQFQAKAQAQRIGQLQQARRIQNLTIARKNTLLYGSVAALLAFLLAGGLSYRHLRARQVIARQTDQLQQQRIRELEQERQLLAIESVLRGQEDERSRLAKDLHDGLGGMLSGVKMTLAASLNTTAMGPHVLPPESAQSLERALSMLDESIGELRRVARNMMPEALVRFGLVDALRDYCDYIDQAGPLTVRFQAVDLDRRLPATTEITLFRLAQELLNNVVKHAGAREAIVQLVRHDGQCSLTVEDDGRGFEVDRLAQSRGSGWASIRSRVDYLGGQLDVRSEPHTGTSVLIDVPVKPEATTPMSPD